MVTFASAAPGLAAELADLVNRVYAEAEKGLWASDTARTTESEMANLVATGQIAVAAVDVELGARLAPEMLKLVAWPSGSVPPGAFKTLQELNGRVVKSSLARGEPIIEGKLAPVGTKGGLSAVVAEGKRAMTVRVNDVVGVAGFALAGNYVDIMVNT